MPLMPLDLGPISGLRTALSESQGRLDAARVDVALARQQHAAALANGSADFQVVALQEEVRRSEIALGGFSRDRVSLVTDISRASAVLLAQRDPALMVDALQGDVPIALLPVRIETRYRSQGTSLAIRIYPDTVHVMRHVRGLTDAERRGGRDYWTAVVAADDTAETVWRRLVAAYRAPRAQFIVRATDPVNPDEAQAVSTLSRQTFALLMPDRFCAVGVAAGRREVFRAWGANVPDILPMSPELDPALATAGEAKDALFGPDREWMFKFEAAVKVGMGIEVSNADIAKFLRDQQDARPFTLSSPLERLVVLGVDWTLGPADAADALEGLLESHAASNGLSCVPLGTATNNTGRGASALNSADVPPPRVDAGPAPAAGATDAYDLLKRALGLRGDTLLPGMLPGAALAEQRTQMHMINALWRGTFGRYLTEMWNLPGLEEMYVSDRAVAMARDFAVGWVRPGGPLPLLRIGKQPYGVLPVVANFQPQGETEVGVQKVMTMLRPRWRLAQGTVPQVDGSKLDDVRELIQSGPWSVVSEFRNIENPNKSFAVHGPSEVYGGVQVSAKRRLSRELLAAFGIQLTVETLLEHVIHDVQDHDLGYVPWVQANPVDPKKPRAPGDVLDPPYIARIEAALGDADRAKSLLSQRQNGDSLLEAMLAFSAEEEFDRSSYRVLDAAIKNSVNAAQYLQMARSKATPSFVNIAPAGLPGSAFHELASTLDMSRLKLPAVTGGQTIEAHVATAVAAAPAMQHNHAAFEAADVFHDHAALFPQFWRDLGSQRASLKYLAPLTVGELDLAFRLTLDTFSYRLDAWMTGLASKRLAQVRASRELLQQQAQPQGQQPAPQPLGVYIGAYGFVENLKPDNAPDSLGYTHAPSLTQAAAAAMLRSGFLANAQRGGEAFNIDLSSVRVHKAMALIEGVERGQSPAALLGYRFERALRDTPDAVGAQYIFDYRRRYPLRSTGAVADEQAESIAARDVVDGVALLDAWRTDRTTVKNVALPPHRTLVQGVLDDLAETWDAVSDVMVAESVYQLAQNNLDRSAAAAGMLDSHTSPITPQVTQTARGGVSYAQRLMLLCPAAALPAAWAAAAQADPRSAIEPRLDAWAAQMLGDPARFSFKALKIRNGALDGELLLTPAELGRGPLSLVLGSVLLAGKKPDDVAEANNPADMHGAPLRRWLVDAFVQRVADDPQVQLHILERNAADEALGLAEFEALAGTLRELIAGVRALNRHDLVVPINELEALQPDAGDYAGVDGAEIGGRADTALALLGTARQALVEATLDSAAITAALRACWPFGLREAEPTPAPVDAAELARWPAEHQARRDRVLLEIDERIAASNRLPPRGRSPAEEREPTPQEAIGIAIDRIKLVFGKDFPVLPLFTLGPYAASVAASLADRAALVGADPFEVAGWLPKLARVREGADRLAAAFTAHEALFEQPLDDQLAVWQLPHKAGKPWAARPEAWANQKPKDDLRTRVPQLAVVAAGADALAGLAADSLLAGLTVDEWQESIPDAMQTTGVSFHYDAPGARPPQAVLLAVPPRVDMGHWRFDDVLATLHEAFDLAQMRCVRPKDLVDGLGAFLPGNFLPQSFGAEVPSVELWQMSKKYAVFATSVVALGKI